MQKPQRVVKVVQEEYLYWDDIMKFISQKYYDGINIEYDTNLIVKGVEDDSWFVKLEFWEFMLEHYSSDIITDQTTHISFDYLADKCQEAINANRLMDNIAPEQCDEYWYKQIIDHIIEEFGGSFDVYFSF